ncbi:phytase [Sediminispirochaeta bajacaliforniensis]|uniref:phytase n=1 Tax=Sediminispirochaeta bajacaliforniensis TaxID=148 RepID=UPI0004765775|nr:phytase [Sediminispirochaeta bajacaliforniensis]
MKERRTRLWSLVLGILPFLSLLALTACHRSSDTAPGPESELTYASAQAARETGSVPVFGDVADDPAIWVHPEDPALSIIIGTDKHEKRGGLRIYDLSGNELHFLQVGKSNNVDVRYDFPFGDAKVDIAGSTNRAENSIQVFAINPEDRSLTRIDDGTLTSGPGSTEVYGFSLYHSCSTGRFYAVCGLYDGTVEQWELVDNGMGKVSGRKVKTYAFGGVCEGIAADDQKDELYIAEENVGLWKVDAAPDASNEPKSIQKISENPYIHKDLEGVALYVGDNGGGYVLVSSQGTDSYAVYDREDGSYAGSFRIVDGPVIDGVSDTDGIEVLSYGIPGLFPDGFFIVQDDVNFDGQEKSKQNFKLVDWRAIANSSLGLKINSGNNPRN